MIDPGAWLPADGLSLEPTADEVVRGRRNTLVIAGPGAGKTELLAQRASFLLETGQCPDPARILAVSFKRDAARNLRDRVARRAGRELACRFDSLTFDAFAKGLLDRFIRLLPDDLRPTPDYQIEDLSDQQLGVALDALVDQHPLLTMRSVSAIQRREFRFEHLHGPIHSWRNNPQRNTNTAAAALLWEQRLRSDGQSFISFPMIGRLVAWLIHNNETLKKILCWSYPFVFLDEFQDATGHQYEVLYNIFSGAKSCLTAVGDQKQRIMVWAGAQRRVFQLFQGHFSAEVKRLRRNYRCAKNIVRLIDYLGSMIDDAYIPAEPMRIVEGDGEVQILKFPDEHIEATILAGKIEEWVHSGIDLQQIVVIGRNRMPQYAQPLLEALQAKDIDCRDDAKVQDMIGSSLSSYFINLLRVATKKGQPDAWSELLFIKEQALGREVDDDALSPGLNGYIRAFRKRIARYPADAAEVADLMRYSMDYVGEQYFIGAHPEYRREGELEREIAQTSETLALFLASRSWQELIDYIDGVGCVRFMTIHKSKGMEFDRVIFLGLEDGALWGFRGNPDEETCNFFVALSRARNGLYFTTCEMRHAGPISRRQGYQSTDEIDSLFQALRAVNAQEYEYE